MEVESALGQALGPVENGAKKSDSGYQTSYPTRLRTTFSELMEPALAVLLGDKTARLVGN